LLLDIDCLAKQIMGKELRTTPVQMKLHRCKAIDGKHWGFSKLQPFFPPLEKLFKTDNLNDVFSYGVKLTDEIDTIIDKDNIRTTRGKVVPIHRKTTSILNHLRWMRGDYGAIGLPKPTEVEEEIRERTQSPHNAAYVGAITSIALSESGCIHFPKVYGVYTGVVDKHTIDISDDYDDLSDKTWFGENIGKTFELKVKTSNGDETFTHTRSQRPTVILEDTSDMVLDVQDIEAEHVDNPSHLESISGENEENDEDYEDDEEDDSPYDVFDIESCDCEDEEDEDMEDDDEEDSFAWATFSNLPVVTTVMEKCDKTFYELLEEEPTDSAKHIAWIAQVVFGLAYAQRNFGLTHNDLHGNNIMGVSTTIEHLYYNVEGVCYKVPTFGYIMKIIDFDRAIVSIKLQGMKESKTFMSSQFDVNEEAGGQYNMEPYHYPEVPFIPACPSFDLSRLATSLFWDMFPEGPDHSYTHPLFNVFQDWMKQPDGSSIMFRKQRDNHDRYHGFDLYKAIARYCKDAVPKKEIGRLNFYQIPSIPVGTPYLLIEA